MTWRVAKCLLTLRDQVDARWPNRNKENDGTIGDASHSARASDHNPDANGVVCAMDITHDPQSGCDSYALAEVFRAAKDQRIKYIISNRKICSGTVDPWQWRPYSGINPHDHHVHVSVLDQKAKYDDTTPWDLDSQPMPAPVAVTPEAPPTLRKGDTGEAVKRLQTMLSGKSIVLDLDGQFGKATVAALKKFQSARGLVADGICGPQSWVALTIDQDGS